MSTEFGYGHPPTLFPRTKIEEDRITSIFFSVLELVEPLRNRLLKSIGKKSYKNRNDFDIALHPSFGGKYSDKDIPDGHIFLDQKEKWNALVEVKILRNELSIDQLENYLERVHENKFDALITISNELCAAPELPPLRLKSANRKLRKINHFHWSWRYVQSEISHILRENNNLSDHDIKLLEHFSNFLNHKDSSVRGFTQMPSQWGPFVSQVKDGGRPNSELCEEMISAWFQETAEIAIILSETLKLRVRELIDEESSERRKEIALKHFKETRDFIAKFDIEGHKHSLDICLDVHSRLVTFTTKHTPTKHVSTPHVVVEHFLKQFHDSGEVDQWGGHEGVRIFANWKRLRNDTDLGLFEAINLQIDNQLKQSTFVHNDRGVNHFTLQYTAPKASKDIQSRKSIITLLEERARYFARNYVLID